MFPSPATSVASSTRNCHAAKCVCGCGGRHVYTYICMYVFLCAYIYTYIYTYIHTYTHTHTHTHTHTQLGQTRMHSLSFSLWCVIWSLHTWTGHTTSSEKMCISALVNAQHNGLNAVDRTRIVFGKMRMHVRNQCIYQVHVLEIP